VVRAALLLALVLLVPTPAAVAGRGDPARGRELYAEKCVLCHGDQGQGWDWAKKVARPPVPVPNLAEVAPERSDRFLFDIIKHGGEEVGRTRFMPGFGFQMSDDEIWDVVAFIRSLPRGAGR